MDRREFLCRSSLALAGVTVLPSFAAGRVFGANDRVNLGFIGLGKRCLAATGLLKNFLALPGVSVVACSDVYDKRMDDFVRLASDNGKAPGWGDRIGKYKRYEDLLADKDIDAVVIATPDHWHAKIAVEAARAGKDIYLEKPLAFTIRETEELVRSVRKNKVILQVGSQQRSETGFVFAVDTIRGGRLGALRSIKAYVGAPPVPYDLPEEPIPAGMDWDRWIGPLDCKVPFNWRLTPENKTFSAWRSYKETGGGYTTDWGAHMFDIAQWAMEMDGRGPVEVIPAGYKDTRFMTFKYDNGITMTSEPFDQNLTQGLKFYCEKGWLEVSRKHLSCSDPGVDTSFARLDRNHMKDFVEAVKMRRDPAAPVEVGASTAVCCILGNMADDLRRPVKWNPDRRMFPGDKQAQGHRLYEYDYRKGYEIGRG